MKTLFQNAWMCTIHENGVRPVFGHLLIQDGQIEQIIERKSSQENEPVRAYDRIFDLEGRVLTIPNVNFHEHIYSRLAKGLPVNGPMNNFVEILKTLWWKLDRYLDLKMIEASAQLAAMEAIQNGVTYLFDHHASPSPDAVEGSLKTIADTLKLFGLRGVMAFEISDRNGADIAQQSIDENIRFALHERDDDMKAMMGLHAPFTLSDATLDRVSRAVNDLHLGIHIHVAEDKADVQRTRDEYGTFIAHRLEKFALLNDQSLLIHGVHLTNSDFATIKSYGAAIAYNPDSNLNNAVGLPRYASVPNEIPILTGTDGMHANVGRSLKQLFLLYRHQGNSFEQTFAYLQKIYFDQLQFVRKYFPDFPTLTVGDRADFIVWDYFPPTPFNADNFWGHFIYGMLESPVYSVVQKGNLLLHARKLLNISERTVRQNIARQGERLFEKFKNASPQVRSSNDL